MVTEAEYKEAIAKSKEAEEVIIAYGKQSIEAFDARWERFGKGEFFKDEDLIYSAGATCDKCKAGLAYPKDCGPGHQWTCSNVLKGIGTDNGHGAYPFAFYEIKSEQQPSARGATTRPKPEAHSPNCGIYDGRHDVTIRRGCTCKGVGG